MKRQAFIIIIEELRNLADDLESQCRQINSELKCKFVKSENQEVEDEK